MLCVCVHECMCVHMCAYVCVRVYVSVWVCLPIRRSSRFKPKGRAAQEERVSSITEETNLAPFQIWD